MATRARRRREDCPKQYPRKAAGRTTGAVRPARASPPAAIAARRARCRYLWRPLPFDVATCELSQDPWALEPRTLAAIPQMLTGMFGDTGPIPARMSLPLRIPSADFTMDAPSPRPMPAPRCSPALRPRPSDLVVWLLRQLPLAPLATRTLAATPQAFTGTFGDTGPTPALTSLPEPTPFALVMRVTLSASWLGLALAPANGRALVRLSTLRLSAALPSTGRSLAWAATLPAASRPPRIAPSTTVRLDLIFT